MKLPRLFIVLMIVASVFLACDGGKMRQQTIVDDVTISTPDSSLSYFTTPDLIFFEVHDHVKTITTEYEAIGFSEDGMLATVNGRNPFVEPQTDGDDYLKYTRKAGRIMEEARMEAHMEYIWHNDRPDSCAWVSESWIGHQSYKYNEKGLLTKMVTNQQDFGELPETVTAEYTYDTFDDHHNWLKRTIKTSTGETIEETRTIEYYR